MAVHRSEAQRRARYGNLCVCGDVWTCPICSATISNARRQELGEALAKWIPRGSVYMATFTVQHHRRMRIAWLVRQMLDAWARLRDGRAYKRLRDELGVRYVVRSLETTWSPLDGWHPHFHVLLFVEGAGTAAGEWGGSEGLQPGKVAAGAPGSVAEVLRDGLYALWARALEFHDLSVSYERGVQVEAAYGRVQDYVAKFGREPSRPTWGPEAEMTQWHRKRGRLAGDGDRHLAPFDFLRWMLDTGEVEPAQLFRDYAGAFFGRRQLSWTPGMRADLGMGEELSDEEIVEQMGPDWELLAMVDFADWRVIRDRELRGELLEVAAAGDVDQLKRWIQEVVARGRD